MIQRFMGRDIVFVASAVLMFVLTCSSCESMRKKFTRIKKKDQIQNGDFIPVLEPEEYPAPEYNAPELYKEHYVLIRVWHKDLVSAVTQKENSDGRVKYALSQINAHLDAMALLLNDDKRAQIALLKTILNDYAKGYEAAAGLRNRGKLQSLLRAFDHKLRHDLRVDVIKKDLVKIESPHQ